MDARRAELRARVRALRLQGMSIPHVARETGVPESTVQLWSKGLALPPRNPMNPNLRERAREMRAAGMRRPDIARALGIPNRGALYHWLKDLPVPEGERRKRTTPEIKARAIELRKQGRSYREIGEELGMPRSTMSNVLKGVPLSEEHRERLKDLRLTGGSRAGATLKARRVSAQVRAWAAGTEELGAVSQRDLMIAGVVAYWAEGSKSKPWRHQEQMSFINSDPGMILLFLAWLRSLGVGHDGLRLTVSIHERADVAGAERYWADISGVPVEEFRRPQLKRHNPSPKRYNRGADYHGCLIIDVRRSTELYRRVEGWFRGLVAGVKEYPDVCDPRWCNPAARRNLDPSGPRSNRGLGAGTRIEGQATLFESPVPNGAQRVG